jgi:hypothetical protein
VQVREGAGCGVSFTHTYELDVVFLEEGKRVTITVTSSAFCLDSVPYVGGCETFWTLKQGAY